MNAPVQTLLQPNLQASDRSTGIPGAAVSLSLTPALGGLPFKHLLTETSAGDAALSLPPEVATSPGEDASAGLPMDPMALDGSSLPVAGVDLPAIGEMQIDPPAPEPAADDTPTVPSSALSALIPFPVLDDRLPAGDGEATLEEPRLDADTPGEDIGIVFDGPGKMPRPGNTARSSLSAETAPFFTARRASGSDVVQTPALAVPISSRPPADSQPGAGFTAEAGDLPELRPPQAEPVSVADSNIPPSISLSDLPSDIANGSQASDSAPAHLAVDISAGSLRGPERGSPVIAGSPIQELQLSRDGWERDLSQQIQWAAKGGMHRAEIRISPPHLGPLEIRVSVQNEHTTVHLVSQHAVVREVMEAAVPRLREMFGDQGLGTLDVSVSNQSAFQQPTQDGRHEGAFAAGQQAGGSGSEDESGEDPDSRLPVQRGTGVVDFFA